MKSPFPGMDPYLEMHWRDVHHALCTYARDAINAQLGGELIARLDERLIVESMFDKPRSIYPDVRVVEDGLGGVGGGVAVADETIAEPVVVQIESEPASEAFIEIQEVGTGRLVTVIEFVSPTNKMPGEGRRQYRKKQRELYKARVSLVEIDLTRGGKHALLAPAAQIPLNARDTYQVCVFRGWRPTKFEIYGFPLRARLKGIRIPLRRKDTDIGLALQPLIDMAYKNGRYDRTNYCKPSIPPLDGDDAAWAAELLKSAGRG